MADLPLVDTASPPWVGVRTAATPAREGRVAGSLGPRRTQRSRRMQSRLCSASGRSASASQGLAECTSGPATGAADEGRAAVGIALSIDRKLIDELATLRFIEEKAKLLLIGPPGVVKTMLATALGLKAVHAGYGVHYTTAADLVARTTRAAIEGRWQTTMRFWNGPRS